ncbi:hypothetical protein TB2_010498 [Malus domestica]
MFLGQRASSRPIANIFSKCLYKTWPHQKTTTATVLMETCLRIFDWTRPCSQCCHSWRMENDGSPFLRPQTNLNPHTNLLGAQEIQSQGLTPSQAAPAVNGSFYSPGTNFSQMNPFDNIPVVPQGMPANFLNRNNAYQPVAGELPRATPRPRISMSNWQENVNIPAQNLLANNNWLPQGQSSQGLQNYSNNASASSSRAIKNALYDPKYEAMGLPIDPHLRLFLAQQRRENDR